MIRLAGLRPELDIKIEVTGRRPGEKLFEEIFHGAEAPLPTEMEGVLVATVRAGNPIAIGLGLDTLEAACRKADFGGAMEVIGQLVPEYLPDEEVRQKVLQ
jgi:O-antigen biosynthesis protein WbqV